MTPVQAFSASVVAVLAAGLAFRRRPRVHVPLMLSAFALDLGSVLYLQVQRSAVQKAAGSPDALLLVHIAFALGSLALYAALTVTGVRLLRTGQGRPAHKALAKAFLLCRTGTLVTSFAVV